MSNRRLNRRPPCKVNYPVIRKCFQANCRPENRWSNGVSSPDHPVHEAVRDRDLQPGPRDHGAVLEGMPRGLHGQPPPAGAGAWREQDPLPGTYQGLHQNVLNIVHIFLTDMRFTTNLKYLRKVKNI